MMRIQCDFQADFQLNWEICKYGKLPAKFDLGR